MSSGFNFGVFWNKRWASEKEEKRRRKKRGENKGGELLLLMFPSVSTSVSLGTTAWLPKKKREKKEKEKKKKGGEKKNRGRKRNGGQGLDRHDAGDPLHQLMGHHPQQTPLEVLHLRGASAFRALRASSNTKSS